MAAGLSAAITPKPFRFFNSTHLLPRPTSSSSSSTLFPPPSNNLLLRSNPIRRSRRKLCFTVCVFVEDQKQSAPVENSAEKFPDSSLDSQISSQRLAEKMARKRSERFTYLVAAVMSSFGITSMAVMAVYYRFHYQLEGGEVPLSEMFGTFALSVGAALHHSDKFNGVPYGLFLGPKEVEEVGGLEELEKEIKRRVKLSKGS